MRCIQGKYLLRACICALLLLVGLFIRLPGFNVGPLWVDELWRSNLILDTHFWGQYLFDPSPYTAITSPFYALLIKMSGLVAVSPGILRFTSLLSGLISIVLMFSITFRSGAATIVALMSALIVALNGAMIEFSNEFKPYAFEGMVHLYCIWLWLKLLESSTQKNRQINIFFISIAIALLSSPTICFLLPSMGVTLLIRFYRVNNKSAFVQTFIGFGLTFFLVIILYFISWRYASDKGLATYWSQGFWSDGGNYLSFISKALFQIWSGSFNVLNGSLSLAKATLFIFAFLLLGLSFGRLNEIGAVTLIFYLIFWIALLLANFFGFWPLGRLRPNLFIYINCIAMFSLVLGGLRLKNTQKYLATIVIFLMVLNIIQGHGSKLIALSPPKERVDLVLRDFKSGGNIGLEIERLCNAKKNVVAVLNPWANLGLEYFSKFDHQKNQFVSEMPICLKFIVVNNAYSDPESFLASLSDLHLNPTNVYWFLYSHLNQQEINVLRGLVSKYGDISESIEYEGAGYFRLNPNAPSGIK